MNGTQFIAELLGTAVLLLLGGGVVANNILVKTKGYGTGFLMVNFGWGFAVLAGILVAAASGAHLNPAVTVAFMADPHVAELAPGIAKTAGNLGLYIVAQMIGAFLGAVLCWLAYKDHFDQEENPAMKLGVFSTGPEIRSYGMNLVTEILATAALVLFILMVPAKAPAGLGGILVAFAVVGVGASLGGPTGYAINPARDLGPRIAHAILPIKGKGGSDWAYSWVPVVGPILGGLLAVLVHGLIA
ncbi:MIP/aquaporin family protein [Falsarthrobacter nasiphocae]|uniref:Glycerol uptake facilitator protein n=1 Tax=Falsarthrobacter nasiphocae TaxID=189863 RepID=A0AAE3YIX8_9MICC|nr:MIP/aquaporin family protein [Falsarthrobacter nasiphocae]MDR6892999.1 glycerol uptake facilitator protein [Falsarthrobacter nasiphocae]